jgi:GNAT superfamily N-acetyltransferase
MPWFACLFVNENHRKKGYAEMFLNHGLQQTKLKGFDNLYLSTDLINFYERKGWSELGKGFSFSGDEIKIYEKSTV